MEKERAYRIHGRVYVLSHGLTYDADKAELVSCVVVGRPHPLGSGRLAFASAATMAAGIEKLCAWVSVPVERIEEFVI